MNDLTRKLGYYIIVEFIEKENLILLEIGKGVSLEQRNIRLEFEPNGFLRYYSNDDERHSVIHECKDYARARQITYWFLVSIVRKINCDKSIVYEKIDGKEQLYFKGDETWI